MRNIRISEESVAIKRMNNLRGVFAVLIVIGHCSMQYEKEVMPFLLIHKFNMVAVCFFFIISGWSLSYNCNNKEGYLKGFLINKGLKLFLFALMCEIFSQFVFFLTLQRKPLLGPHLLLNFNWYVYETIIFYILFFLIYKIKIDKRFRLISLWIFSGLLSVMAWVLSNNMAWFSHSWHFSSLCFAWGITIHECRDCFKNLAKRRYIASIILLIIGMASCVCIKMPQGSLLGGVILHNLIGISIISLLALWSYYFPLDKIPLINLLTKYSTEIYLYQFSVLIIVYEFFLKFDYKINFIYVLMVILFDILLAIPMHYVDKLISKGLLWITKR